MLKEFYNQKSIGRKVIDFIVKEKLVKAPQKEVMLWQEDAEDKLTNFLNDEKMKI